MPVSKPVLGEQGWGTKLNAALDTLEAEKLAVTTASSTYGLSDALRGRALRGWDTMLDSAAVAAPRLFLYGHSVVSGVGASTASKTGFAALIGNRLPSIRPGAAVTSSGHSGQTTAQLLAGIPTAALTGLAAGSVGCVVIMGLINDYYNGVAPATTQANLTSIIAAFRAQTQLAAGASFVIAAEWDTGVRVSGTEPWSAYVAAARAAADADDDALFVDLGTRTGATTPDTVDLFDADNVHPNDRGHAVIAAALLGELVRESVPAPLAAAPSHTIIHATTKPLASTNWPHSPIYNATNGGWFVQSNGTQNAELTYEFTGDAGIYDLALMIVRAPDGGQYTPWIDGVEFATAATSLENYAASTAPGFATRTGFVIPTSGRHTLRLVMATKNASSTAYRANLVSIHLTRMSGL